MEEEKKSKLLIEVNEKTIHFECDGNIVELMAAIAYEMHHNPTFRIIVEGAVQGVEKFEAFKELGTILSEASQQ